MTSRWRMSVRATAGNRLNICQSFFRNYAESLVIVDASHRPWPIPISRPAVDMTWHDLLFMHWPVKADDLRPLIPQSLEIDTFAGEAWIGVVPFRMTRVKPYRFPSIPRCSAFPELNVRTYVTDGKK